MTDIFRRALLTALAPGGARGKLTILQLHRIPAIVDPLSPNEMARDEFERFLDFLVSDTRVLSLADGIVALGRGKLPSRAVALTFDDGYAEWVDVVSPLLRNRSLHATFFVTTEQFSGPTMWHERINAAVKALPAIGAELPYGFTSFGDLSKFSNRIRLALEMHARFKYVPLDERIEAIEALEAQATSPLLLPQRFGEDGVRNLHNQGFEIGAHTVRHPILNESSNDDARDEIMGSKEQLEAVIGAKVKMFAYPNGRPIKDFMRRHVDMVKACGYSAAVITGGGAASKDTDLFQLPRFMPWGPGPNRMAVQMARNFATPAPSCEATEKQHRKTRVLFVENGAGFGGAIVALQTLLENLPTDQFEYDVVTNLPVGRFAQIPAVSSHRVISDQSIDTRDLSQRVSTWGAGRWVGLVLFLVGRLDDLVNRLPYLTKLTLHVWRLHPDIIHGNNEPASNREAMLVAKLMGKRYVQHVRGPTSASRHTPWLMHMPTMFITVSRWLADDLIKEGVPSSRIRHIYDAIDLVAIDAVKTRAAGQNDLRAELGLQPDVVLVAMVGMLVGWKGQKQFIDAVSQIDVGPTQVAYLIVGGTPERSDPGYVKQLQEQVRAFGLQDRVIFTGKRSDMAQILPQINIVVSASTEPEPLGLVMLEAMTNGCTFVGPAFGAAPEVVEDGVNGYLFEPKSAESMAERLTRAITTLGTNSRMSSLAKEAVRTRFSGQRCALESSRVHRSVMDRGINHL